MYLSVYNMMALTWFSRYGSVYKRHSLLLWCFIYFRHKKSETKVSLF